MSKLECGVKPPIPCLAQNVKAVRARRGLTQEQLAEKSGIKYKYLQSIEGGKLPGLSFKTLEKLAVALKVECWELICPRPN
jgi:transcriptional regulator with XRE-family HTH domain